MKTTCAVATALVGLAAHLQAATNHVALDGMHQTPFHTWATAATNIQAAIDVAQPGDCVLVSNGVYTAGFSLTFGGIDYEPNRVVVDKPITLCGLNGAAHTVIDGGGTARCVVVQSGGIVDGFTLTNAWFSGLRCFDHTVVRNCVIAGNTGRSGGGAVVLGGVVSNCVIAGNTVRDSVSYKGAVYIIDGLVEHCVISHNDCKGVECRFDGVVQDCLIADNNSRGVDCEFGGVVQRCTISKNAGGATCYVKGLLQNCTIVSNRTGSGDGGGVWCYSGTVRNCLIRANRAGYHGRGGGVYSSYGAIQNCTIAENSAPSLGPGVFCADGRVQNSIIWNNSGTAAVYLVRSSSEYNCIEDYTGEGEGTVTQSPQFIGPSDFHLQSGSPCRNTGTNLPYVATAVDMDGTWRIMGPHVDMGAYEFSDTPFITSPNTAYGTKSVPLVYQTKATADPLWFNAQDLPPGLTVNQTNGVIAGAPEQAGIFVTMLTASNPEGTGTGLVRFTICGADLDVQPHVREKLNAQNRKGDVQMRCASVISARAAYAGTLNLARMADESLVVAMGDLRLALPFDTAVKCSAGKTVFKTTGRNSKGKDVTVATVKVKKTKRTLSLAIRSKATNFLTVARAYTMSASKHIVAEVHLDAWIGSMVHMSGDAVLSGKCRVRTAQSKSDNGGEELPRVKLKNMKLPEGQAMVITSPPSVNGTTGVGFDYLITSTGNPTNFLATGLPADLMVDAHSGRISGIPANSGVYTVRLSVAGPKGVGNADMLLYVYDYMGVSNAITRLNFKESLKPRFIKGEEACGVRARQLDYACRTILAAEVPWSLPLDFTALADEDLEITAGDLELWLSLANGKLTPDSVELSGEDGENTTQPPLSISLKHRRDSLKLKLKARSADYLVAADGYAGQPDPLITTQEYVSVTLGAIATFSGTMNVRGRSTLKKRSIDGQQVMLPCVRLRGSKR